MKNNDKKRLEDLEWVNTFNKNKRYYKATLDDHGILIEHRERGLDVGDIRHLGGRVFYVVWTTSSPPFVKPTVFFRELKK